MNFKKALILSGFIVIIIIAATQIIFAQEAAVTPADSAVITSNQQSPSIKEGDMQWAWGEVINLDNQAKTITLKYLDYEADQEKELVLVVDEKTTFENIKDFNELKLKDTLSIDYILGADNKNIAKNISLEKPDDSSALATPQTAAPDLAQPTVQSETPVNPPMIANGAPAPVEPALLATAPVAAPAPVEPAPVEPTTPVPAASEPASTAVDQAQ